IQLTAACAAGAGAASRASGAASSAASVAIAASRGRRGGGDADGADGADGGGAADGARSVRAASARSVRAEAEAVAGVRRISGRADSPRESRGLLYPGGLATRGTEAVDHELLHAGQWVRTGEWSEVVSP